MRTPNPMTATSESHASSSCFGCRDVGHRPANCPDKNTGTLTTDANREAALLTRLRPESNAMCTRCTRYPIARVSEGTDVLDALQYKKATQAIDSGDDWKRWWAAEARLRLSLGQPNDIFLHPSCPLCIFDISAPTIRLLGERRQLQSTADPELRDTANLGR